MKHLFSCLMFCALLLKCASSFAVEVIQVDAGANRRPIDPRIYGVANAAQDQVSDLNVTLNRQGGNNTSRYNWTINADNRAADYFFESLPYPSATPGEHADTHVSQTKAAGAEPLLTVPMLPWVAKLAMNRGALSSFSVAKYGAQQFTDPFNSDFGNGVHTNATLVTGNDPNDANVPSDSAFQANWITHLISKFNTSANGGVRYYMLDNEPGIWHLDHRDVHPVGSTMQEVRDRSIAFATQIKALDPNAIVVGPEEWNYEGYFFSGYDEQYRAANGFNTHPDRDTNGGMEYLPWLLDQLHQKEVSGGTRLLDIFSVHYYPQDRGNNGTLVSDDVTPDVQARRNRATRSLWDPTYLDESYLGDNGEKINLIPRLKGWVNQYYPNTQVAINEYNFGAENHINGGTSQADLLGIFGREGLDMACRWEVPPTGSPTYNAMKIYRNYDGAKSTFGDTSVKASVVQPDSLAAFAATRTANGDLTVMVINKITTPTDIEVDLANFTPGTQAQAWQLTSANTITRVADVAVAPSALTTTVPAQSITLFIIPASAGAPGNHAPVVQSTATALPNPAKAGQSVGFSVSASDVDGDALTYQWNFGDGTQATGAQAVHAYAVAGAYIATVSIADGKGGMAGSSVNVMVAAATGSSGTGTTGGTGGLGGPGGALTVTKLQANVVFTAAGKDTLSLTATLPNLPAGFSTAGTTLTLDINGTSMDFQLDASGKGSSSNGTALLKLKGKRDPQSHQLVFPGGSAPLTIHLTHADLSDALGIDAMTPGGTVAEHLDVSLGGADFSTDLQPRYTVKAGKSGKVTK